MHPPPSPRPHHRLRRLAPLVLALGLVAACGGGNSAEDTVVTDAGQTLPTQPGGSGGGAPSGAPTGVAGDVNTLTVTLEGGGIVVPTELEPGPYEIEVVNQGGEVQDLTVSREGEEIVASEPIDQGLTDTVTVTLDAGEYVFATTSGDDRVAGAEVSVAVG